MARLNYRPEIDGIRALAVLSVLFFHSQLRFPGGYVGVDIFFVISGFLITALINQDLVAGRFSLRDFWERRVRRIMPAASVTVAVSLVLGFFLMLPADFEELGRSAVAQALVAANVFFFLETDYFAGPAESKPLLHFWSLALEEQFYLLFPFVLLALHRWRAFGKVAGVATIAAVSFALSVVGAWRFPDATFYLLPTRAWELALGALLALRGGALPLPETMRAPAGWAGLAMMVAPMFLYDHETPFPGLAAVPPCLGALLVIWSTGDGRERVLKRLLSLRPVVFIGLISYSLYLWHWPVKVFSHYWFTGLYSPLAMRLAVVPISFGLAWLSWRYVELPFRHKRGAAPSRRWAVGALAASALTLALGALVSRQGGLPERLPPEAANYAAAVDDRPTIEEADLTVEEAERGELPALHQPVARDLSVLLWGDSHARVVSPAVEAICRELGVEGYRASRSETASLLERGDDDFRRYSEAVYRWIATHRPTIVVMVSRWERVLRSEEDEADLRETVAAVQRLGVRVALMRQVASQRRDIPKALVRASVLGEDVDEVGVPVAKHAQYTQRSNEIIDRVAAASPGLMVLDPIPYLSREGRCIAEESGRALYYDYQHLTRFGASFLRPMFASMVHTVATPRRLGMSVAWTTNSTELVPTGAERAWR